MVHVRDGPSTVCRIIIKSDKECPRDASARTIRDTRTRIRGRNLIPSAAIKADTGPVDVQRERELERERERRMEGGKKRQEEREREREIAPNDFVCRDATRCLAISGEKITVRLLERSDRRLWKLFRDTPLLFLSLSLSLSHALSGRLPRP